MDKKLKPNKTQRKLLKVYKLSWESEYLKKDISYLLKEREKCKKKLDIYSKSMLEVGGMKEFINELKKKFS